MHRLSVHVVVVVLAGLALTPVAARAAPRCLQADDPCDPDKLCTFKFELAAKEFVHQTYLANSQKTKKAGKRDGVRYRGDLYNAALAEARAAAPNATATQQKEAAAAIFDDKVREKLNSPAFRPPPCRPDLGGEVNDALRPKPGYGGMSTNAQCQVFANFEAGEADAASFGSNDPTQCVEFYDRDRAHEAIHKKRCEAKNPPPDRNTIDGHIEEEIEAYKHSVDLSKAYVKLLSFQCSANANPAGLRARAKQIEQLLAPWRAKAP